MRASRVTIRSEVVNEQEAAELRRGRAASFPGPWIGRSGRPGLPERAAAHRGAVSGGRFHGYGGAHAGAEAQGPFQSTGAGVIPHRRERPSMRGAWGEVDSGAASV